MFIDLVGSTKLSAQLDPEDYRDMVRAYQNVCTEVIQRYDGYVAQLLGDGLLVYFGYPLAHEDDAHRAVHTGLGILDAMETFDTRLKQEKGIQLAVRLGIHTGLVVVGEMGGAGRQEQLALGRCPILPPASKGWLPNSLVVSEHLSAYSRLLRVKRWVNIPSEVCQSPSRCIAYLRKVVPKPSGYRAATRIDTISWPGARSRSTPGTVGTGQIWARAGGLTEW